MEGCIHGLLDEDPNLDAPICQRLFKESVKKSLLKALQQDKYDFEMEGVRLCDFRATLHHTLACNTQLEEAQSQLVLQVTRTAEKQQLSQEQLQYKQWVEAACEGGMKGLCKAIKSPETNLLRPYRDKPLEIRPHLRRAEWRDLWIGPKQDGSPLQAALDRLSNDRRLGSCSGI